MRSAIGSFSGDDDEIGWDYEFQSALSEAIEHAMDADGEASRPIYIEIDGRIFKAQRVAVIVISHVSSPSRSRRPAHP